MRVYVAGPIFGKEDRNRTAFEDMSRVLKTQLAAEVIIPLDIVPPPHAEPEKCPPGRNSGSDHNEACHLRADVAALLTCDAVCVLSGWQLSHGARLEVQVATACGIPLMYVDSYTDYVRYMT